MSERDAWPALPLEEWADTCKTLHMWMQIVGKVKLALTPFLNEYWNVALFVTVRGLTTGLMPYRDRALQIDFDFEQNVLSAYTDDGMMRDVVLRPRSVADFYAEFMETLRALEIEVTIDPLPTEVQNPIRCDRNDVDASYDSDAVTRWWRILVQTDKVLQRFRSPFVGKSSPINFFWGSFDLSHTRFSGRPAPQMEGAPRFFQVAEDQENIAFGFWPGQATMSGFALGEPAYYSYAIPAPPGYSEAKIQPAGALFHADLGEFILPYEVVRTASDPAETLLQFFQSAYEAGADLAKWDRAALEAAPPA